MRRTTCHTQRATLPVLGLSLLLSLFVSVQVRADFYNGLTHYDLGEYDLAAEQWKASAKRGDAHSMFHLSELYRDGKGVTADRVLALMYLQLASAAGHREAERAFSALAVDSKPEDIAAAIDKALTFKVDSAKWIPPD